jgi:hypothetical protein
LTLSHVTKPSWPIVLFGLSTSIVTLSHPMASDQNSTVMPTLCTLLVEYWLISVPSPILPVWHPSHINNLSDMVPKLAVASNDYLVVIVLIDSY